MGLLYKSFFCQIIVLPFEKSNKSRNGTLALRRHLCLIYKRVKLQNCLLWVYHYLVSQCFGFSRQTDPRSHLELWGAQCGTEKSSNLGAVLQLRRFGDHPITQMTQPVLSLPQSCSEMGHVGWWLSCSWRHCNWLPPTLPLIRSTNLPKKTQKLFKLILSAYESW